MTADDVLRQAIQGISDLILVPGLINLDFADVKTIMAGMGIAMMGTGIAEGENRAMDAAQRAISSPLLEGASVEGARGVIINVTGGPDLSLLEVSEASTIIQEAAHEDANIIFGAVVDEALDRPREDHGDRHRLRPRRRHAVACGQYDPDTRGPVALLGEGPHSEPGVRLDVGARVASRAGRARASAADGDGGWRRGSGDRGPTRHRRSTCRRSCGVSTRASSIGADGRKTRGNTRARVTAGAA